MRKAAKANGLHRDKQMQILLMEEAKMSQDQRSKCCTANVILIIPVKGSPTIQDAELFVANAGDSRAILGAQGRAVPLSYDHKPTNPSERARIAKAGSYVNHEGRVDGNLNLSRAIGDLIHKGNKRLSLKEQAITSFPDVKVVKMHTKMDFIVMGCDGIWESHTN